MFQLHLDATPPTPEAKEVDFFAEHNKINEHNNGIDMLSATMSQPVPIANGNNGAAIKVPEGMWLGSGYGLFIQAAF